MEFSNPKLARSLKALYDSIETFEKVYAKYKGHKYYDNIGDIILDTLEHSPRAETSPDIASVLERRVSEIMLETREHTKKSHRWKRVCEFVAKLYPVVKVLIDLGQSAAPVPHPVLRVNLVLGGPFSSGNGCYARGFCNF